MSGLQEIVKLVMIPLRWVGGGRSQKKVRFLDEGPSSPGVMRKFCDAPVGAEIDTAH